VTTRPSPLLDVVVHDKRFRRRKVLQDVHLDIAPAEIVGLVGPSGCGKSTLLRIVAGLDTRYRGEVLLDGHPLRGLTRDIGFIFQEPRLFPWLTVSENVAFELGRGGDHAHHHPRVVQLLAEVGLAGYERALPKTLSGGQAQRVAIARGLFREPRVLLLDEPFSAVDPLTRVRLQELLIDVAIRHAVTVLLVTHDIDEALFLSDRVLVLGAVPGLSIEPITVALQRPRDRDSSTLLVARRRVLETLGRASARLDTPPHRTLLSATH